ncbi:MAG: glycoside hydrolase family 5 protein [Pseudobutyrivibrio sp.]|nr:glycoside hydrolase family 5 protein [Pseudobutyrivibrio sp.]
MVTKKQKFRTVILILALALVIVGAVFAIAYFKGGVTFPWDVAAEIQESQEETLEEEPEKIVVEVVEPEKVEPEEKEPEKKEPEEKGSVVEEPVVEEPVSLTGTTYPFYGKLSVKGGRLVDSKGEMARLVGVSSHGLSWFPDYVSEDSIRSLKEDFGLNTVRLAMYTSDYNGYCVGDDNNKKQLKALVDDAVDAAVDNDMYVIIDWHVLNDRNPNQYKDQAIQFFGEMVRKYQNVDNVIYEICNEPNGDTSWDDIKDYAEEIIPVIRNVNSDAIILVGTPEWSSDLDSVMDSPLRYDNIMYTYHFYAGSHGDRRRDELADAVNEGLPVFISECGFVNADGNGGVDKDSADKWLSMARDMELPIVVWNLSNKNEGSALIKSDCSKTSDWTIDDLSNQGKFLIEWIQASKTE